MDEKPKILIIEDDPDLVAAMKKMLENKGFKIIVSNSPEEGNEKLRNERPDLIILDVMFGSKGESQGFDFVNKIRTDRQFSGTLILMLTAINSIKPLFNFSPGTDGEYLPVDSFLDKPVKFDELFLKVEYLLEQKTSKWRNWPEKEE
jgi:two-component system, OmpR family, alkaline phosphatase synthesis response regulator PhoP